MENNKEFALDVFLGQINRIKTKKKMTIKEIAEKAGITESTALKIFSGKVTNPTLYTVMSLAKGLGVTVNELVYNEYSPEAKDFWDSAKTTEIVDRLKNKPNLITMLDAFDELSPDNARLIDELMNKVQGN